MRIQWRTGSLTERVSNMTISKPIYFLMILSLVVGLVFVNTTHIELFSSVIKSEEDIAIIETLATGGSFLLEGEAEETLDQITAIAQRVRQYFVDGRVACSMTQLYALAGMGYVQIMVSLIYVIGIAVALVPLFMEYDWKARYLIPANLAPIVSMVLLVLACVKMDEVVEGIDSLLGSGVVEIVRTNELTLLIVLSAFNLIFASCLIIGIVTSNNTES